MSTKKTAEPPQQRIRDKSGRFIKGQTGCSNSPGRPKMREEFKNLALELSIEALMVVKEIMTDPTAKAGDRAYCARLIMEYGYGRPSLEYDREKLDIDKKMAEAQIRKIEKETDDTDGPQQIEVLISNQAKEWGK